MGVVVVVVVVDGPIVVMCGECRIGDVMLNGSFYRSLHTFLDLFNHSVGMM